MYLICTSVTVNILEFPDWSALHEIGQQAFYVTASYPAGRTSHAQLNQIPECGPVNKSERTN